MAKEKTTQPQKSKTEVKINSKDTKIGQVKGNNLPTAQAPPAPPKKTK